MTTATKPSQDITRAAERYLEQCGDPLVMNTYLKITVLVLAVVCLALAGLVFKSQKALADMHPLIVRINDVGRAEAIDYRNFQYRPQEAENKYYLTRWAELYFSRNRFTIERDQTNSLYFLNGDVQRAVIDQERKDNIIPAYIKDSTLAGAIDELHFARLSEGQPVFNFFSNRAAFPRFPTTGNASRPSPGIMSPARRTRWLFRPTTLAAATSTTLSATSCRAAALYPKTITRWLFLPSVQS